MIAPIAASSFYASSKVAPSSRPLGMAPSSRVPPLPAVPPLQSNATSQKLALALRDEQNDSPTIHATRQDIRQPSALTRMFMKEKSGLPPTMVTTRMSRVPNAPSRPRHHIPIEQDDEGVFTIQGQDEYHKALQAAEYYNALEEDPFTDTPPQTYNRVREYRDGVAGPSHEIFLNSAENQDYLTKYQTSYAREQR